MKRKESVKEVLSAIDDVRLRMYRAYADNDPMEFKKLGGDLNSLEYCLIVEAQELIKEMESAA